MEKIVGEAGGRVSKERTEVATNEMMKKIANLKQIRQDLIIEMAHYKPDQPARKSQNSIEKKRYKIR